MADPTTLLDNTHGKVLAAQGQIRSIPIGSLNDTERELALSALRQLRDLDEALAVRSGLADQPLPMDVDGESEPDTANALEAAREYGPSELYSIEGLVLELEAYGYDVSEPEEPFDLGHAAAPKDANGDPVLDAEVSD